MASIRRDRILYTGLLLLCMVLFWAIENHWWPEDKMAAEDVGVTMDLPDFLIPSYARKSLVKHRHYMLSYNEAYEQAAWVAYGLKASQLSSAERKRPYFIEDPQVKTFSADWKNYKNSGYNRGHLCPAGDRKFSKYAYEETFFTSNISPMKPEFNAGVWNRLELQVRNWVRHYDSLYVITGGVLRKGLPAIGYEKVAVPDAFYKIVVRGALSDPEVLAFLIPHEETAAQLSSFSVSVDQLERLTGIDFFPGLADVLEDQLESEVAVSSWKF